MKRKMRIWCMEYPFKKTEGGNLLLHDDSATMELEVDGDKRVVRVWRRE